jgi:hypothetical protein
MTWTLVAKIGPEIMLKSGGGAVTTDLVFTISLKRSTLNIQLSTSWAGRLPYLLRQKQPVQALSATRGPYTGR